MKYQSSLKLAAATQGSVVGTHCQVCDSTDLKSVLFVGYLPPVNTMPKVGTPANEQPSYPAEVLHCQRCQLFQIGLTVDPAILFPPSYPYTSGTTKILRENFAELYQEVQKLYPITEKDLVVDIGSNDGTLLSNFHSHGHRVCGIEPTNAGNLANQKGIKTHISFFNDTAVNKVIADSGKAKVITIANCFAHMENIHGIMEGVLSLLTEDGVFITESHYLVPLLKTLQYDTVYHEHLRYYSVTALKYLLAMHGLEIIHVKPIPTHGGSIRVYAGRKGKYPVQKSVEATIQEEKIAITPKALRAFKDQVTQSKLELLAMLKDIKANGEKIYGIGAPSRSSTLINYVGLDDGIIDAVLEIDGSYKIGKYIPGTLIPVKEESILFKDQPEYALLFSWHIADELIPKLQAKGFKGKFIVPLPTPKIIDTKTATRKTPSVKRPNEHAA